MNQVIDVVIEIIDLASESLISGTLVLFTIKRIKSLSLMNLCGDSV